MKKVLASSLFILFILVPHLHAQTRVLFGAQGGSASSNINFGALGSIEAPLGKHFEIDLLDSYSPYESHPPYGIGRANTGRVSGIQWSKTVGLTGSIEYANYSVKKLSKGSYYAFIGPVFRWKWFGSPTRLELDYAQQVHNQVIRQVEPSYLRGGRIAVVTRLGCTESFCYRLGWEFRGERVLQQSSPVCERTTCPRNSSASGEVEAQFVIEFPRRRGSENDAF